MRIIFNGLAALKPRTGVGCYVVNLLDGLRRVAGRDRVQAFPHGWAERLARVSYRWLAPSGQAPPAAGAGNASPSRWPRPSVGRLLREAGRVVSERAFRWACRRSACEVYHEPNFIPWPCELPTVITLHDLSVVLYPQWHPADRVKFHERHFERGLSQGCHFVTVSEYARQEVLRYAGLPDDRVTSIHNGIRSDLRPLPRSACEPWLRRLGLEGEYLLAVGTIEPRKNLLTLMRAYGALPAAVRERFALVLAGGWGWNCADIAAHYQSVGRHQGVRHLGHVPDEALPALYNGARALLYPSHYEGFGLPPLEMMACGGAVLPSSAGAVREVLAGYPVFIDPHDADGWRDALLRVCGDDDWWRALRHGAVERARPFTWDRCARATWRVYESLPRRAA